ncbi:hypothetical protein GOV08_05280 [Candidatus Woesearchaeota archaeon]|nr:hypothetical protein [Candidatus Woesearchaeota archaeon]
MKKYSLILLLLLFTFTGCSQNSDNVNQQTVLGEDLNNDGIRDDVEEFIDNNYPDSIENKQLRKYAANVQEIIIAGQENNRDRAIAAAERHTGILGCLSDEYGSSETLKKINDVKGKITDNRERVKAYVIGDALMGGYVFRIDGSVSCD